MTYGGIMANYVDAAEIKRQKAFLYKIKEINSNFYLKHGRNTDFLIAFSDYLDPNLFDDIGFILYPSSKNLLFTLFI